MRRLAQAIAALVLAPLWAQSGPPASTLLYVSTPLQWERSPRPGQPAQRFAHARILAIESDGGLATISCLLYRTQEGRFEIMYTEGYSLSSGTWKRTNEHLAVRLRPIHSNIRMADGASQPVKEELWAYGPAKGSRLAAWIKIGNSRFTLLENLGRADKLAEVIQFHRKEAENPK